MSDDLGNKIQKIAEMLGQDTVPDNVKELVTLIAGSLGPKTGSAEETGSEAEEAERTREEVPENSEIMNKAKELMDRLNTQSDPRIDLLHAIKPFMSSRRQRKIGNCIQLLQVAGLNRFLNDSDRKGR